MSYVKSIASRLHGAHIAAALIAAAVAATAVFLQAPATATAHWNGGRCGSGVGHWLHPHTRYHYFLNSVDDADWRVQTRDAQVDWDRNTHIATTSTSNHAQAHLHAVDAAYGRTGWSGVASYPCYHDPPGQEDDHIRMNLTYESQLRSGDLSRDGRPDGVNALQAISCQEIGHMIGGLNHYPGDCMGYTYYSCSPCSVIRSHTISDVNNYYTSPPDGSPRH